ncbi:MAG: hypothetical protein ACK4Y5_07505 [Acetobacteraceae bacterium]
MAPRVDEGPTISATGGFFTLFSVRFQHSYYNLSAGRCPDFTVIPTQACAGLMKVLGMVFKNHGHGFSVVIPENRIGAMMNRLFGGGDYSAADHGIWTRLSFYLVLNNPAFIGFTAMPIGTSPTRQNLYASNLQTSPGQDAQTFGTGGGLRKDALYAVTGPTVSISASVACTLTASDVSGTAVASASTHAPGPLSLSLPSAAKGLYSFSVSPASAAAAPDPLLFVPAEPLTFGLVDLFLTQPAAGMGDVLAFPVPSMSAPHHTSLRNVSLILPFDSRSTYINYYVVSRGGRGHFSEGLTISGKGTSFVKSVVTLPSRESAMRFSARAPLPLSQRSNFNFVLSGQRFGPDGSRNDLKINPLPSAPASPVWPAASGDDMIGVSEIYVYV